MGDQLMSHILKKFVIAPALALAATATTLVVAAAPADAAVVSVRVKGALPARTGAANWWTQTRTIRNTAKVTVTCKTTGQYLRGNVRRTAQWDRTAAGDYISHAYVSGNPKLPTCVIPAPAPVAAVPLGPTGTMTNEQFLAASIPAAQQSQRETRVPTSVTLAQAILESGWGRSSLSASDRNFFGMKCFNNVPGSYAAGCKSYSTQECNSAGVCSTTVATFRTYNAAVDSFRDHGMALKNLSRYAAAFLYTNNPNQFVAEVHKGGYATDPLYTTKLQALMAKYNLYRYDLAI
ncbi:sporangiospore maturation cell wall hydrolase GsmA [Dactylosporangium sp. AC04546]|uniref:sporangiospore maturation cell wall hydrolase GsmA n=1 Tax=Dactylosporangium sp. AC04546 TaxID=2862460 RepID=UPI001EDD7660|nr:sporangiospore maturation cell wall hydrolase GsmA [Dactylosporangium sp. AC04546]WVK82615.1 sporangiospore maturation cell wall hydrolase GsmA [Dactylosporangium sp. AC04546]